MSPKPDVLIVGHSFVHRFELFLSEGIDTKVRQNLNLSCSTQITFLRVGGRTVHKLSKFDLHLVRCLQPQIVILEIGSNDLSPPDARPKVVGSKIETLVQRLHAECQVETIVVCQTINRATGLRDPPSFNDRVALLNQYLSVVLFSGVTKDFDNPPSAFYAETGYILMPKGNMLVIGVTGALFYPLLSSVAPPPRGGSRSHLKLGPFLHPHFLLSYMTK